MEAPDPDALRAFEELQRIAASSGLSVLDLVTDLVAKQAPSDADSKTADTGRPQAPPAGGGELPSVEELRRLSTLDLVRRLGFVDKIGGVVDSTTGVEGTIRRYSLLVKALLDYDLADTGVEVEFRGLSIDTRARVTRGGFSEFDAVDCGCCSSYEPRQLLKPMSGVLRSGSLHLLLGKPGSGKSTFMRHISGRFSAAHTGIATRVSGDVLYNGQPGGGPCSGPRRSEAAVLP